METFATNLSPVIVLAVILPPEIVVTPVLTSPAAPPTSMYPEISAKQFHTCQRKCSQNVF